MLRKLFKESSFGRDIYNFAIEHESSGDKVVLKATDKGEKKTVAGFLKVQKNVIVTLNVSEETKDPTYELLKFLCRMYDEKNQPLTADQLSIPLKLQRTLEAFGFRTGDDNIMMRLPNTVIPYSLKT
jgi:hypothetical protein